MKNGTSGSVRTRGRTRLVILTSLVLLSVLGFVLPIRRSPSLVRLEERMSEIRARSAAEAGVWLAIEALDAGREPRIGVASAPRAFGESSVFVRSEQIDERSFKLHSTGRSGNRSHRIEAVVGRGDTLRAHAIWSGSSSEGAPCDLILGGQGPEPDMIGGDSFASGDIVINGGLDTTGRLRASGLLRGRLGISGFSCTPPIFPTPDDDGLRSDVVAPVEDFDLGAGFGAERRHRRFVTERAGDVARVRFAVPSEAAVPEEEGQHVAHLLVIDGDLWLTAGSAARLELSRDDGRPLRLTIVVRGNIWIARNVGLASPESALALLALGRRGDEDAGSIYLGDPLGEGTLTHVDASLLAVERVLDVEGSVGPRLEIQGRIVAGRGVGIERGGHGGLETLRIDPCRDDTGLLALPHWERDRCHAVLSWIECAEPVR